MFEAEFGFASGIVCNPTFRTDSIALGVIGVLFRVSTKSFVDGCP